MPQIIASSFLLTGSLDETVKLWKSDELDLDRANTGHCLGVVSVVAHPSGYVAASASLDSFVRVFEVGSNSTIATLEAPPSEVWQMRFNPESTAGSIGFQKSAWFSSPIDTESHVPMSGDSSGVLSVDASPDGAVATGSSDRTVMLWDLQMRAAVQTMIKHSDQVCWGVVAFRPHDGAGVEAGRHASVSDDKSISLYDYI
ncbi:WD repeat-containing protein VIP3, partial [Cucurbita argyrosperma subsp. sororia]